MLLQNLYTVSPRYHHVNTQLLNHRTGVDNLPGEVSHLLQEIRHRESRAVGQLFYPFFYFA